MTEVEAQRKRCPANVALNCIGSVCMAWRERSIGHMTPAPGGRQHTATKDGYCGLAGAPS